MPVGLRRDERSLKAVRKDDDALRAVLQNCLLSFEGRWCILHLIIPEGP